MLFLEKSYDIIFSENLTCVLGGEMKKKKWNFGTGLIVMILVVSIGSICAFNRPRDIAQGKAKKVSNVQPNSRLSTKKVEKKISESSTEQSESTQFKRLKSKNQRHHQKLKLLKI